MSLRRMYLLQLMLLCFCCLMLLPVAFSARVLAYNDPITITSQTDAVHFPAYIDFTMSANDSVSPITQATIYIAYKELPNATPVEHTVTISRPARFVSLRWHEDTGGDNFHYAGTPVEYYWVLQDSLNHQYTESPQDFTVLDTRFSWQHLSQGLLQVNWYKRPLSFGQILLAKAQTSLTHISQVLGGGLLHPINLWVYANDLDFHGALAPGAYEWVGGEAHPQLNEAFISVTDSEDDTLVRDMPHEMTHLIFHQLIGQGQLPPTWFDEGLAVYNQFYHEPEMNFRFNQALASHTLLRLDTITNGFPADAQKAYLAYGESWNLVDYMYSTFGEAKMALLIQKMNSYTAFDQDLTQALGEDQVHLENQWRLHLNQPPILGPDEITPTPKPLAQASIPQSTLTDNTAPVLLTLGGLLIVLPMIGIVAILVYQRRSRA